jgi:hypothetical protein
MRLVTVAVLFSSLTFAACEAEAPPAAAPTVVVVKAPPAPAKPAPTPTPTPTKDSLQIGPGGVAVENKDSSVKIAFPKR